MPGFGAGAPLLNRYAVRTQDIDVFGYPYLISSLLPGTQGRDFFERPSTSDDRRCRLLKEFGSVVAAINELRVPDGLLPVQDVTQWREDIMSFFV